MLLQVGARNFRGLREARYDIPEGVSVLVGPNGAGKSTLLGVLDLLKGAYQDGILKALQGRGGTWGVRTLGSPDDDREAPVELTLTLDRASYALRLPGDFEGLADPVLHCGELLVQSTEQGTDNVLDKQPSDKGFLLNGTRHRLKGQLALRAASDLLDATSTDVGTGAIVGTLTGYSLHPHYNLSSLRRNGSQDTTVTSLSKYGSNVFTVLRNWHDRRAWQPHRDFVTAALQEVFPDLFQTLDFERAGQSVSAHIVTPRHEETIPCYFAPSGFLVSLLHLCAVASAEEGSVVAIDGFENELHPFAIRHLIDAFRTWANEHKVRVVLATYSPVVLNQFKREPDKVLVMDPREPVQPVRLDKLYNAEWLAQFSLGDLYAFERFGAPVEK